MLNQELKDLIDFTRGRIKSNEDDFDHITKCLQEFKDKSIVLLMDVASKSFGPGEQVKLEE
jgi:hypothetical protein